MKTPAQRLLRRLGLLERLRASILYDLYWRVADRRLIDRRARAVRFYRSLLAGLPRRPLIFDVGANCGDKTDVFLRLGARVVAVEPDPSNQNVLERRFHRLRLVDKPVVVVGKAVGDRNAVETLWIEADGSALNTLSAKRVSALGQARGSAGAVGFPRSRSVATTTLEDLIAAHGVPFFVKIDVEGYELHVLRGLKRAVPFVSFEVNLPEFRSEGLECVAALDGLERQGRFNYAVDCEGGLALHAWLDGGDFGEVLARCAEPCVEVFWRSGVRCAPGT